MSLQILLGLAFLASGADLVDVTILEPRFVLDIKYATKDNFTKRQLYPVAKCLLRPSVAEMLVRAQRYLDEKHSGYVLLLKDCYRPHHIQKLMWKVVKGTKQARYVANPYSRTGSVHNYGAAVDLTLRDPKGKEVDMGTPYDAFVPLAEPRHEARFLKSGVLSPDQLKHRRILRSAMRTGGGFRTIRTEWWHFDALQGRALRRKFTILDQPLR